MLLRYLTINVLLLICLSNKSIARNDCNIIIKSNKGIYKGCNQSISTESIIKEPDEYRTIYTFKGIPYAKPPIGELRFRKPVPITYTAMTEVDTSEFKKSCKQPALFSKDPKNFWESSEDCLYLNVFTPSLNRSSDLPVMVNIHGGGFQFDGARQVPGEQLTLRDVVVVTMDYRLGVFGFLCTDSEDAPGNVGLWDQAMALNWTKNNIRSFGGNPDDITIFGQSAGAVSVSSHIVSDVSREYFKSAILQSGSSLTNVWLRSKEYSTRVAKRFSKFVGCNRNNNYIECLRNKSADNLIAAQITAFLWNSKTPDSHPWYSAVMLEFVQCYGDEFLPEPVFKLLESGNFNKDIHILSGHTTLESAQFTYIYDLMKARFGSNSVQVPDALVNLQTAQFDIKNLMINNDSFDEIIAQEYTKSFNNMLILTPIAYFERQRLRAAVIHTYSDYSFVCPTVLFGKYLASDQEFTGKVFQYYLKYANSQSICKMSTWCTNTHFDDQPLVFGQPFYMRGYTKTDKKMSSLLMDIFTHFAKTKQAPEVNGEKWPEYSTMNAKGNISINYLELDSINNGRTYYNRYRGNNGFTPDVIQNCEFWEPILRSLF